MERVKEMTLIEKVEIHGILISLEKEFRSAAIELIKEEDESIKDEILTLERVSLLVHNLAESLQAEIDEMETTMTLDELIKYLNDLQSMKKRGLSLF